jgi:hypothetical protein
VTKCTPNSKNTAAGARNVLSGNGSYGVQIDTSVSGTLVQGNLIGTKLAGTSALANGVAGVEVRHAGNTIGGSAVGAGNVGRAEHGQFEHQLLGPLDDNEFRISADGRVLPGRRNRPSGQNVLGIA